MKEMILAMSREEREAFISRDVHAVLPFGHALEGVHYWADAHPDVIVDGRGTDLVLCRDLTDPDDPIIYLSATQYYCSTGGRLPGVGLEIYRKDRLLSVTWALGLDGMQHVQMHTPDKSVWIKAARECRQVLFAMAADDTFALMELFELIPSGEAEGKLIKAGRAIGTFRTGAKW